MRPIRVVEASFLSMVVATVHAQEGGIINPARTNVREQDASRSILRQIDPVPPRDGMSSTIEGLPGDARVERLTWERAYALALVRSRDKGKPLAPKLDPKALDERAEALGVADFARFRREFLAGEGSFKDPSARYFDLLGRSRTIDESGRPGRANSRRLGRSSRR